MISLFKKIGRRLRGSHTIEFLSGQVKALEREFDILKVLKAKTLCTLQPKEPTSLEEVEFRAFSQYGEDGIIQFILSKLSLPKKLQVCVEIGCESYHEANTRLLLELNLWHAIVFDGSEENINAIRKRECSWRLNLESHTAFITKENINEFLAKANVPKEIGLLSMDVDGIDYWAWEALTATSPIVIVIEYNGLFGGDRAIAVPYDPKFNRFAAHPSGLFWGCSLKALEQLGERKGYVLIGSNSAGCNAFFVRSDFAKSFKKVSAKDAYRKSISRDARDVKGEFLFHNFEKQRQLISNLSILDVEGNMPIKLEELLK